MVIWTRAFTLSVSFSSSKLSTYSVRRLLAHNKFCWLGKLFHRVQYCDLAGSTSNDKAGSEVMHTDYVALLKSLQPSEQFCKLLNPSKQKQLESILAELEIFAYLGTYVPQDLCDSDWQRLLELSTVSERVTYLEFLAVKQKRKSNPDKKAKHIDYLEKFRQEEEKFKRGEMGYGNNLYQLVKNPFRIAKKKHNIEGARMACSMITDVPQVALDMQHIFKAPNRVQSELGKQMQYVISENLSSRMPFPLKLVNFESTSRAQLWLKKSVGFYEGAYTEQTILPEVTEQGIRNSFPDTKNMVYITRDAREMLDGPITHDVLAVCISKDLQKESLGSARRAKIRPVRLPIRKYIKWQSGPMYIPFPNLFRILREVYISGGDWEAAFLNNISKRHLITDEERNSKAHILDYHRQRAKEKQDLINTICQATGNQ